MKINTKPRVICFIDTEGAHFVGKVEGDILSLGGQMQARLEPLFRLRHALDESIRSPAGNAVMGTHHQCILSAKICRHLRPESQDSPDTFEVSEGKLGGTDFSGTVRFSRLEKDRNKMNALERQVMAPV